VTAAEHTEMLARLAVRVGANVAPGQDVFLYVNDVEQAPLARAIAAEAYAAGAHFVSVVYWDQHVKRSRLQHAPVETLAFVPDWWERFIGECIERRGACIAVMGDPDPELLADVDPARAAEDHMPLTASTLEMVGGGEVNWTVVPGPTAGMARRRAGRPRLQPLPRPPRRHDRRARGRRGRNRAGWCAGPDHPRRRLGARVGARCCAGGPFVVRDGA